MQGRKDIQPKMMYQVHLDNLVSQDNYYRQLNRSLDLSFLYKATEKYYGTEGQESIDPVVFFKICLIGYLNNIRSDRRLIEYCSNCLDIRLYLKYDIDEVLPWHSTISRTRQLYGEEVFVALFQEVLSLCIKKGMVRGKRQAIDSAFIQANASLDSLVQKEIMEDVKCYSKELNDGSELEENTASHELMDKNSNEGDTNPIEISLRKTAAKSKLNQTHYSPTDPDARVSTKPGKAPHLNYFGQIAVDDAHHVITGAMANFADKKDCQCLPSLLQKTIENLKIHAIKIEQVCADTNYSSGSALDFLEQNQIEGYIPNSRTYKPTRDGFLYNPVLDQWECQRGNKAILYFKGIDANGKNHQVKLYRSSRKDCKNCPFISSCFTKKNRYKKISDSVEKPFYDRMQLKVETKYGKKIAKIRSRTVEPVLGTLINFTNMKRVNTRGINLANKHVLMAALSYNLKKYLKFISRETPKLLIMEWERTFENKIVIKINIFKVFELIFRTLNNSSKTTMCKTVLS